MTRKLYDVDSHLKSFPARVLACQAVNQEYQIILDQTAFFPTGGGQAADTGTLNDIPVFDVAETEAGIVHITKTPLAVGSEVLGQIDWDVRFSRMQQHSGEHIVSGVIHKLYGYDNVGFHMGSSVVTVDYNGVIPPEELKRIEYLANEAVTKNVAVTARYPQPVELEGMNYRSKLDLTENVRIVSIEGYDTCACCAPHVSYTGELGLIKLLDCTPNRGGVRITMLCGFRALEDVNQKLEQVTAISRMLSVKQDAVFQGVEKLQKTLEETRQQLSGVQRDLLQNKLQTLAQTEGDLVLFEPDLDSTMLRELVNTGMQRCGGLCAAFGGEEGSYRYVIGSQSVDLSARAKELNRVLNGRGGGTASMIQGSVQCTKTEILEYFK